MFKDIVSVVLEAAVNSARSLVVRYAGGVATMVAVVLTAAVANAALLGLVFSLHADAQGKDVDLNGRSILMSQIEMSYGRIYLLTDIDTITS